MTKQIRGLCNIAPCHKAGVVAIGNFDGVHLGHQALIRKVKECAQAMKVPSIVMTFEPQPMEFLASGKGVARLTRWREKFSALAQTGVDYVLVLPFNQKLATLTAPEFIKSILVQGLAVKHVIVGDDFRFGFKRQGDFTLLEQAGAQYHFSVEAMPSVVIAEERVSSSRIRSALAAGDHGLAEQLLGRPYTMMGRVVQGNKLGRQLGFPTANIELHRAVSPVQGIYVVRMHGVEKQPMPGAANVGIRPTIGGTRSLLEVHLLNFDGDIYGKHVCVEFCKKIREEERYANLELLRMAIAKDVAETQRYFEHEFSRRGK